MIKLSLKILTVRFGNPDVSESIYVELRIERLQFAHHYSELFVKILIDLVFIELQLFH